jgi:F-type H+-transporting ATPase subunit b
MDIQFPQILFQIINFGVVFGALTYLLYKPVKKMLAERSMRIEEAQKAAEVTIAEKKAIDDMKVQAKKQAEKEAAEILEKAVVDAAARKKQLMSEAKKEAEAELTRMMETGKSAERAMLKDMESKFAEAVISTTEKLVGSFDKKASQKVIDAELKNLIEMI